MSSMLRIITLRGRSKSDPHKEVLSGNEATAMVLQQILKHSKTSLNTRMTTQVINQDMILTSCQSTPIAADSSTQPQTSPKENTKSKK